MTEKEIIDYVKENEKFPRTFDDYTNFIFYIFPAAFIAIGISMIYNYFKFDSGYEILLISIVFIFLSLGFFYFINTRLHDNITFKTILPHTTVEMKEVADRLSKEFRLSRIVVDQDLRQIIAFTKMTGFSWGEQITLVFEDDKILVNSRPSGSRQPFTIIKDRQNIKKVESIL